MLNGPWHLTLTSLCNVTRRLLDSEVVSIEEEAANAVLSTRSKIVLLLTRLISIHDWSDIVWAHHASSNGGSFYLFTKMLDFSILEEFGDLFDTNLGTCKSARGASVGWLQFVTTRLFCS